MQPHRFHHAILTLILATLWVAPSHATSLVRMGVEKLATTNQIIVLGEVIDSYSYWNASGTFIFTDVRIEVLEVIKGDLGDKKEIEVTLMGGTVGELTTMILAGAELAPETPYLLFLDEAGFPGGERALTVRDHCQGVFEVRVDRSLADSRQLRAVSQATAHGLKPDSRRLTKAPGGAEGLPLEALITEIRSIIKR